MFNMCIQVLQSLSKMNCPKASFEGFILWCCPEGTYVERGGRLLSFTRVPRPECSPPVATMTENTGGSQVGVWVSLTLSVLITIFVFVLPVVPKATKKREERGRGEKRAVKKKKKKSVGFRAKKGV